MLDEQIRDLLGRLSALSEANASRLDSEGGHGVPESRPPAGATLRGGGGPPDKERSLYDWYRWQFDHVEEPDRRLSLFLLGELEYAERTEPSARVTKLRRELRAGQLTDNDVQNGGAAESAHADRVIAEYEGFPALYVAMIERTSESWVCKARRQAGRKPEDGRPRAEFLSWPEERRESTVAALHAEGLTKTQAGDRLGVDRKTVDRYWPEPVYTT